MTPDKYIRLSKALDVLEDWFTWQHAPTLDRHDPRIDKVIDKLVQLSGLLHNAQVEGQL